MIRSPLTPEEVRRLASRFCGPPRILSSEQVETFLGRKRKGRPLDGQKPRKIRRKSP